MPLLVHFMTLKGPLAVAGQGSYPNLEIALRDIEAHAARGGFHTIKTIDDPDSDGRSVRVTATTKAGRSGRNIAFIDYAGEE